MSFAPLAVELMKHILKVSPVAKLHPGLDKGHFCDPAKALTNGCDWKEITKTRLSSDTVRLVFETVKKHNRQACVCRAGDPCSKISSNLSRPGIRTQDSMARGIRSRVARPYFLGAGVDLSTQRLRHRERHFSFADHAAHRRFSTWADLLGHAFVRNYETKRIGAATESIYFDNKDYFCTQLGGRLGPLHPHEHRAFTEGRTRAPASRKGSAFGGRRSPQSHPHSAADRFCRPLCLPKPGSPTVDHKLLLNVFRGRVLPAAEGPQQWGGAGNFPWLSNFIGNFFSDKEQLDYFAAWLKRFYSSAARLEVQRQAVFLVGATSRQDVHEYPGHRRAHGFTQTPGIPHLQLRRVRIPDVTLASGESTTASSPARKQPTPGSARWSRRSLPTCGFECHEKFPGACDGRVAGAAGRDGESGRRVPPILPTLDIKFWIRSCSSG